MLALGALLLALLALVAPLGEADVPARVGVLLLLCGAVEIVHALRRRHDADRRRAWTHGAGSVVLGVLLINAPLLAGSALIVLLVAGLGLDAAGLIFGGATRRGPRTGWIWGLLLLLGAALVATLGQRAFDWAVATAVALRIGRAAYDLLHAPVYSPHDADATILLDAGLPDTPEMQALAAQVADDERRRVAIDRGWIIGFLATLLAIHVARMGFDRSALGLLSPGVAVLGDVFVALAVAFGLVIPAGSVWRRATVRFERRAWDLAAPTGGASVVRRCLRALLTRRLRARIRLRQARYSLRTALGRGLQVGLPVAAVIAATTPIWGMSWYFDTENWAAGVWNSWAEQRTDTWREAMTRAVAAHRRSPVAAHEAFAVRPSGIAPGEAFSFVVIGDPGEGDASQHSLRASLLDVARRDDVKFVLISSDVVYPTGAMRHYESNFWIPFMGITKPIYAIPGNHDWYDALEAFAATFFTPESARLSMRARIETDRRLTSTNEATIERLIAQATRWRQFYGVPTQQQTGPYFQLQTESFALFAVDTGVARRVDDEQWRWLEAGLRSAEGKMKMVVLGHPFIAGGRWTLGDNEAFAELHDLLRAHGVMIVMAGDTHDLEYYRVTGGDSDARATHHFVNGGGGAYLSFGTPLDWPDEPATEAWAYYPGRREVVAKIESTTPRWKWPVWLWTREFGGWPFSAEFLAAAFDVNASPFFQSFVEVRVEPSDRRVRIIPYGVHGRLRWRDLDRAGLMPLDAHPDDPVEWVLTDDRGGAPPSTAPTTGAGAGASDGKPGKP